VIFITLTHKASMENLFCVSVVAGTPKPNPEEIDLGEGEKNPEEIDLAEEEDIQMST
jgi:hypothetical protein